MSDLMEADAANTLTEYPGAPEPEEKQVRAKYGLEVFGDEMPDSEVGHRGPGPSGLYRQLECIAEDADLHGKWIGVATYQTSNGATSAANRIRKGQTAVPNIPGTWEFRVTRRRKTGVTTSILGARFVQDAASVVVLGREGATAKVAEESAVNTDNSQPETVVEEAPKRRGRGKARETEASPDQFATAS